MPTLTGTSPCQASIHGNCLDSSCSLGSSCQGLLKEVVVPLVLPKINSKTLSSSASRPLESGTPSTSRGQWQTW